ncbi:hypothetical protein JXA85_06160, partial [Candidatus Woesearchaeota archaeon]|nr:hypothetical protein [Candidatus Woesearchaeota archaeon]
MRCSSCFKFMAAMLFLAGLLTIPITVGDCSTIKGFENQVNLENNECTEGKDVEFTFSGSNLNASSQTYVVLPSNICVKDAVVEINGTRIRQSKNNDVDVVLVTDLSWSMTSCMNKTISRSNSILYSYRCDDYYGYQCKKLNFNYI